MLSRSIAIATDWPGLIAEDGHRLFLPALHRFPAPLRELMGVLPVVDMNGELLSALAGAQEGATARSVAGLFAADPFLDRGELARSLLSRKIVRVANFPTVQLFDGSTAASFSGVGYDLATELSVLKSFEALGFEAVAYVTTTTAAAVALERGFATLAYHPGLAPWRGERSALSRIERMAHAAGASVLRHQRGLPGSGAA